MAQDKLKTFLLLIMIFRDTAAVTHSLQYFYTASEGIAGFPEFVAMGMVDSQPFYYYNSDFRKAIPKQDWINKSESSEYWEEETQISINSEKSFKANIKIAKQRFNQTKGVHVFQRMYGCEWDEETGETKGYYVHGYDGEDFLVLDMKTESWIAATQKAFSTKQKWDHDRAFMKKEHLYFTEECPQWLIKYLNNGRSFLMRTDLPSVSFLQKTPSSPVTCHATGFYPNKAEIFWRKNGEEIHEGVDKGEVLPNSDGSFQMSVDVDLSSTDDWTNYECVFQLSGAKDIIHPLEKTKIKTNYANSNNMIIPIIVTLVVFAVIAGIGVILYKKKNAKRPPSPVDNAEVQEQMIPQA